MKCPKKKKKNEDRLEESTGSFTAAHRRCSRMVAARVRSFVGSMGPPGWGLVCAHAHGVPSRLSIQRILLTITIGTMSLFVCRSDPRSAVTVPDRCRGYAVVGHRGGCADDVSHKADGETESDIYTQIRPEPRRGKIHCTTYAVQAILVPEHTNTAPTMSHRARFCGVA